MRLPVVVIAAAAALPAFAAMSPHAHAQGYPAKPVRLIVPFPAGGPVDTTARIIAPKVGEALGQNLVIENRVGASSMVASEHVAKSAPDGYTVLLGTASNTINTSLVPKMPYDLVRDFEPGGQLFITPSILAIHPALPVKTVKELIALAKARPKQLSYASSGNGTPSHVAGELLKTMGGVELLHVPYKGAGTAVIEQIAGLTQVSFLSAPAVIPFVKNGKLRGLAVTNAKRSLVMPELPTIAEAALPGYESEGWSGIFLPAKTPAAIVQRLHRDFTAAVRDNEATAKLITAGTEPAVTSPEALAQKVRDEILRWSKVVKAANIRSE